MYIYLYRLSILTQKCKEPSKMVARFEVGKKYGLIPSFVCVEITRFKVNGKVRKGAKFKELSGHIGYAYNEICVEGDREVCYGEDQYGIAHKIFADDVRSVQ